MWAQKEAASATIGPGTLPFPRAALGLGVKGAGAGLSRGLVSLPLFGLDLGARGSCEQLRQPWMLTHHMAQDTAGLQPWGSPLSPLPAAPIWGQTPALLGPCPAACEPFPHQSKSVRAPGSPQGRAGQGQGGRRGEWGAQCGHFGPALPLRGWSVGEPLPSFSTIPHPFSSLFPVSAESPRQQSKQQDQRVLIPPPSFAPSRPQHVPGSVSH